MELQQELELRIRVELKVMTMNEYTALAKFPDLESYDQTKFSVISRTPFLTDFIPVQGM